MQIAFSSYGELRGSAHVTEYLIGVDQKILDQLIKVTFLGRSKLQLGGKGL